MSQFAENLSPAERKRGRILAYFSTYSACISEVMIDSSALIIIYITLLGGSNAIAMLSTSFCSVCLMLLSIPSAIVVSSFGRRKSVLASCITGCIGFLIMTGAPLAGQYAWLIALLGCLVYSLQRSVYSVCWYGMLDQFLRPQDRGPFFGFMRYTYLGLSSALFFVLGLLLGKTPPVWLMQIILAVTGLLILGRAYCMLHFPYDPHAKPETPDILKGLCTSFRNSKLTGYTSYLLIVNLFASSLLPIIILYLKNICSVPPNRLQLISSIAIVGGICANLLYGWLTRFLKLRSLELLCHLLYLAVPICLIALPGNMPHLTLITAALLFLVAFCNALFAGNVSIETLKLSTPDTANMTTGYILTYQNAGAFFSRTATSMLLGTTALASVWNIGALSYNVYQFIFMLYCALGVISLFFLPIAPSFVPQDKQ